MTIRECGLRTGWRRTGRVLLAAVSGLMPWNGVTAEPEVPDPASSGAERAGSVHIEIQHGLVTLQVARASRTEVLEEFGRRSGIRFHYAIGPEGEITASCVRMTLTRALECLLGRGSAHMLRYPPHVDNSRTNVLPTDVWLLGQPRTDGLGHTVVEPPPTDSSQATTERPHAEGQDYNDVLTDVKTARDADARVQALSSLAASGDRSAPAVQEAFRAALLDLDGKVRAQGVYALARDGGPEAIDVLRKALKDSDASVRLMAVDTAKVDAEGTALLEEALTDDDASVRMVAVTKLGLSDDR